MKSESSEQFFNLLSSFSKQDELAKRKEMEKIIWDEYGSKHAVLVLDMSGFSLLAQKYGVVHYLSMVNRMHITSKPIINSHGGSVIKFEADNCFAVFPDSTSAIQASIDLNHAFDSENILTPDELDIKISIGNAYGEILIVDESDFFGNAVNRASKLGEDIAEHGEILVTKKAMDAVPEETGITGTMLNLTISGIELDVYKIKF